MFHVKHMTGCRFGSPVVRSTLRVVVGTGVESEQRLSPTGVPVREGWTARRFDALA